MRTQTTIFTTDPPVLLFSGAIQDPQGDLGKHRISNPISKGEQSENLPPRLQNETKHRSTLESPFFFFFAKTWFRNTFLTKSVLKSSTCQDFHSKIGAKTDQETSQKENTELNPSETKNLSKWGSKITSKSSKNWF